VQYKQLNGVGQCALQTLLAGSVSRVPDSLSNLNWLCTSTQQTHHTTACSLWHHSIMCLVNAIQFCRF